MPNILDLQYVFKKKDVYDLSNLYPNPVDKLPFAKTAPNDFMPEMIVRSFKNVVFFPFRLSKWGIFFQHGR